MGFFDMWKPKKCPVCGLDKIGNMGFEKNGVWYCSEAHANQGKPTSVFTEHQPPQPPKQEKGPVEY